VASAIWLVVSWLINMQYFMRAVVSCLINMQYLLRATIFARLVVFS